MVSTLGITVYVSRYVAGSDLANAGGAGSNSTLFAFFLFRYKVGRYPSSRPLFAREEPNHDSTVCWTVTMCRQATHGDKVR